MENNWADTRLSMRTGFAHRQKATTATENKIQAEKNIMQKKDGWKKDFIVISIMNSIASCGKRSLRRFIL